MRSEFTVHTPKQVRMVECSLSDGNVWGMTAHGEQSAAVLSCLSKVMQLRPSRGEVSKLIVLADDARFLKDHGGESFSTAREVIPCLLPSSAVDETMKAALTLQEITGIIGRDVQKRGGILLHGALAEYSPPLKTSLRQRNPQGNGVILAGRSNAGKTTASQRLTPPWRSLCDDVTLVVCDEQKEFRAHPWPSVSQFLRDETSSWNVQRSVPLTHVLFLHQAKEDRLEPVGSGKAVSFLIHAIEQIGRWTTSRTMDIDLRSTMRMEYFDTLCALVRKIPVYLLHFSLHGRFWEKIEDVF